MKWKNSYQLSIISILFIVLLSAQVSAGGNRTSSGYLKEPAVKWENNVITGELRNVPIKGLLEELLRREGFDWEVIGELNGTMSISFDHLTVNEGINKIMRLNRFNYALIVDGQQPDDSKRSHLIRELTIYREDKVIRFSRTHRTGGVDHVPQKQKIAKKTASKHRDMKRVRQKTVSTAAAKDESADFPLEIQEFVNELLTEKKISPEEYKKIIKKMGRQKK